MKKGSRKENEFYDMSSKVMRVLCQSSLDTLRAVIDIEVDCANLWQEYLKAQIDRLSTAKEISDVMAIESGLTSEYTNKFSETSRRFYETVSGVMEKQMQCLNMPADVKSLLPNFQGYGYMPNTSTKNSEPAHRAST